MPRRLRTAPNAAKLRVGLVAITVTPTGSPVFAATPAVASPRTPARPDRTAPRRPFHCERSPSGGLSATFADACALTPNSQLTGTRTEPFLSPVESLVEEAAERATDVAVSAIIRRAGVLLPGNHDSIDLWPTTPERLSVEILTHDRSEQTFERMLASLTSLDFAPRLLLKKAEGHRGYRSLFQIIGHDVEIDLRIQTL